MKRVPLFVLFVSIYLSCTPSQKLTPVEQTKILMDTFVQITIFDQNRQVEELEKIIESAFQRIKEIDRITNQYNDSSLVSIVNRNACSESVELDSVLQEIILSANKISKQSAGAFDITIGSVKRLWNFSSDNPRVPDATEINNQLEHVDYRLVKLENHKIKFNTPKIKIDLGAIAKGFAIDEAIRVLQQNDIKDAMVNAGGDLRAICSNLTQGKRKVWIKHPRIENKLLGYFQMDNGSVATSGDYERFFIQDSTRYFHILDPKTGYPARGCVSVTIQTNNAMIADALATAVFVLGIKKGMDLINRLPDVEGIILFKKEEKLGWKTSAGLKEKIKIN